MKTICYMRVSTGEQDHGSQRVQLEGFLARQHGQGVYTGIPCDWIEETGSGAKHLPARDRILERARRSPVRLIVWKLDRLGRSTVDVLSFLDALARTGSEIVIVDLGVDTSTPAGRFFVTVLAAVAELERSFIVARVRAGLERAKKEGTKSGKAIGRPKAPELDAAEVALVMGEVRAYGLLHQREPGADDIEKAQDAVLQAATGYGRPNDGPMPPGGWTLAALRLHTSVRTLRRFLARQNPPTDAGAQPAETPRSDPPVEEGGTT